MKREIKYILDENEITCIGDLRRVKSDIDVILSNESKWNKEQLIDFMKGFNCEITTALKKLEII